jgi:hypothetical protein
MFNQISGQQPTDEFKPKRKNHPRLRINWKRVAMITGIIAILLGDGFSFYVQYREGKNAADTAALMGAYAFCTGSHVIENARHGAEVNGFVDGENGAHVMVESYESAEINNLMVVNVTIEHPTQGLIAPLIKPIIHVNSEASCKISDDPPRFLPIWE